MTSVRIPVVLAFVLLIKFAVDGFVDIVSYIVVGKHNLFVLLEFEKGIN